MVEFYLLTFPRFPLRKKEHKSYLVRIELTTSALAGVQVSYYLIDHSVRATSSMKSNLKRGKLMRVGGGTPMLYDIIVPTSALIPVSS